MKKIALILGFTLTLFSCENKEAKIDSKDVAVEKTQVKSEFSNPAYMDGSSFGKFFIAMIRTQNYDMALKFTSKESINKFGVDKIKEVYSNFKFNYKLEQKSITVSGKYSTIIYTTNEYATCKLKKLIVILENDTCKLVLPVNINEFLK